MAANATGKSGDPIIIEDASLRGDSADNPIEIKEDAIKTFLVLNLQY